MADYQFYSIKKIDDNFNMTSNDFYIGLSQTYINTKILFDILKEKEIKLSVNGFTGLESILRFLIINNLKSYEKQPIIVDLDIELTQTFLVDNTEFIDDLNNKFELNINYCKDFPEICKFFICFLASLSSEYLKNKNINIGDSELNSFLDTLFEDTVIPDKLYNLIYNQYILVYNL